METNNKNISRTEDKYDLLKMVLAFLIVILHTSMTPEWGIPVVRMAVPLFFMLTAFFFFRKYDNEKDKNKRHDILLRFQKRNLYLYLFWLVVLLLPTLALRWRLWFSDGVLMGGVRFVQSFFFGSTFRASWFLMASIIATSIIASIPKKIKIEYIICASFVAYVFSCLGSSYYHIGENVSEVIDAFELWVGPPHRNFIVALLWISFGKYFVNHKLPLPNAALIPLIILALCCLYFEYYLVISHGWMKAHDSFLSLSLVCPLIFQYVQNCKPITWPWIRDYRSLSVITYCLHATIVRFFVNGLKILKCPFINETSFLLVLVCCYCAFCIIKKYETKYPILKYSY